MTKAELEKEAEKWLRKYLLCYNCEKKCNCIDSNSYCEEQVLKSYLAGAEPRENRIAELEAQLENDRDLPTIAYMQGAEKQKKKDAEQLTKAKEIIKNLLFLHNDKFGSTRLEWRCNVVAEAAQFLSEEVEK